MRRPPAAATAVVVAVVVVTATLVLPLRRLAGGSAIDAGRAGPRAPRQETATHTPTSPVSPTATTGHPGTPTLAATATPITATAIPVTATASATAVTGTLTATPVATGTVTATPSMTPTVGLTATVTATRPVTATVTVTATRPVTATTTAMPEPTDAPTARPEPSATEPALPAARRVWLPAVSRASPPVPPPRRVWGLQFALEDMPERYEEDVAVELPRARAIGLTAIRTNLRWDWVEPRNTDPDGYDWSLYDRRLATYADAGYDLMIALVAYPAWATRYQCGHTLLPGMEVEWRRFVREAVLRYSDPRYRVAAWEVGNEVDGKTTVSTADYERSPEWGGGQPTTPYGGCWGDRAPAYAEFLRAAYEETKAVDPSATVTLGGLANADIYDMFHMDFLERLLAAGGGAHIDVLNFHWFPDVPGQVDGPEKLRRLQATLAAYGYRRPAWLTETYRLTYPEDPRGEASQIDFLGRELVELLANPDLQRVYWYGWVDFPPELKAESWHPDRGIVRATHVPKAALSMLPWVVDYTNGVATDISTADVAAYRFQWPRQPSRVVAWSRTAAAAPLVLEAPRGGRAIATYFPVDMLLGGACCGRTEVPATGQRVELEVGADSLFVRIEAP